MKKFAIFTLCLVLCGVLFGGCRRNVGTDTSEMTTMPTTQPTTAATTEATTMPSIMPTVPMPSGDMTGSTDDFIDGTADAAPGPRGPMADRPVRH